MTHLGRAHVIAACVLGLSCGLGNAAERPNILLIMADDLGAENLGCYGNSVYSTPNLDRMAREGAVIENAFATPVCTPTRAMILTGLHPNRSGFLERLDSPLDRTERRNRLPTHLRTFGHVFQDAGYTTAIAGKWHLGDFQTYPDQPASHGFSEYSLWVQYWDGSRKSRYYAPHIWENGRLRVFGKDVFGPDHYADFLVEVMQRSQQSERPFLCYLPMNLIHGPLVSPPGDQADAQANYPADLGESERVAGQMVHYMDKIVGRLLSKIKDLGIDDKTIVLFTGDNGTAGNLVTRIGDYSLRGGKRTMNEAGTRVPLIARWSGKIPPGRRDAFFSLLDVLPTLASMADIPIIQSIDGMDLSHNLFDRPGNDREYFFMAFEGGCFFVRDKRFRLHEDGRFYDVPVSSVHSRYSMKPVSSKQLYAHQIEDLQRRLKEFKAISKTDTSYHVIPFGTNGDVFKNKQDATQTRRSR